MMKALLVLILLAVSAPAGAVQQQRESGKKFDHVQIFEDSSLDRPFTVIGKGRVKSSALGQLARNMKALASREGGDAVLKYKVENTGSMSYWSGGQISYAEGIIVKFDPKGITSITEKTRIPVIQ